MDVLMTKLTVLVISVDILDGMNPIIAKECQQFVRVLDNMKAILSERTKQLQKAKAQLEEQEIILKKIEMTHAYLNYMEQNMPDQLKNRNIRNSDYKIENGLETVSLLVKEDNQYKNTMQLKVSPTPLTWESALVSPVKSENVTGNITAQEDKKGPSQFSTPQPRRDLEIAVNYVTNTELSSVPSYMRGRITQDHINAFIEVFNSVLSQKYAILRKPKSLYKVKKDLDQYVEWRSQETSELKGYFFCTAKDLSVLGGKKMTTRDNNIVIILRHVKRIREVRNKKLVFFVGCF